MIATAPIFMPGLHHSKLGCRGLDRGVSKVLDLGLMAHFRVLYAVRSHFKLRMSPELHAMHWGISLASL